MAENVVANPIPDMEVAVLSEAGKREENQDWMSWFRIPWGECYIVADGMGGYKGGSTASRMTVEGLERHLAELPADWPFEKALAEAARKTNDDVLRAARSGAPENAKMGSTVAVALISGNRLTVGHIGDSRIYLFRHGKLRQLTTDHTSVQRMVDAGILTPEQAREHPEAHVLSRAVGSRDDVEIEIGKPIELENGDGILLCSDGLSGYVEDEQIRKMLTRAGDVQALPKQLIDLALKTGSDDNITVQFVRYGKRFGGGGRLRRWVDRVPGGAYSLALVATGLAAAAVSLLPPVRNLIFQRNATPPPAKTSSAAPAGKAADAVPQPQSAPLPPGGKTDGNQKLGNTGTRTATLGETTRSRSKGKGASSTKDDKRGKDQPGREGTSAGGEAARNTPPATGATDGTAGVTAPAAPAPAPNNPSPVQHQIVVVVANDDTENSLASAIERALRDQPQYKVSVVHRSDLGDPPPDPFVYYTDREEQAAKELQRLLPEFPGGKPWKLAKYGSSPRRQQQYQGGLGLGGQQHLLIVFPRQEARPQQ